MAKKIKMKDLLKESFSSPILGGIVSRSPWENNIRPRDKGFFVRHFTMGTGFRKANLYYDGVHWQGKKKF